MRHKYPLIVNRMCHVGTFLVTGEMQYTVYAKFTQVSSISLHYNFSELLIV